MTAAIMIMAHSQPSHFGRLLEALASEWAFIFVHIDAKADIKEFIKQTPGGAKVLFLDANRRVRVWWGGFSIIRATLNLLESAINFGLDFDRYCLLSGSDYPIKSMDYIAAQFASDKEFMRIEKMLGNTPKNSQSKRVNFFYFMDNQLSGKAGLSGVIPRKRYARMDLYHGSQWWSLTANCVRYIIRFLRDNGDYVRFFRHVLAPDEIFFHSIVKNSPFAGALAHDFERASSLTDFFLSNEHGCHYIDWHAEGGLTPKILDAGDLDYLINSQALFARKFDENRSGRLLAKLDELKEVRSTPATIEYINRQRGKTDASQGIPGV